MICVTQYNTSFVCSNRKVPSRVCNSTITVMYPGPRTGYKSTLIKIGMVFYLNQYIFT